MLVGGGRVTSANRATGLVGPLTIGSAAVRCHVTRSVRAAFLDALRSGCSSGGVSYTFPVRLHRRLWQASDYIAAHLGRPIYMDDLSQATDLTQRGLENLFQDFFGLSPVRYRAAAPARRPTGPEESAAGVRDRQKKRFRMGFWHHGHFAAGYRALFGESPGATWVDHLGANLAVSRPGVILSRLLSFAPSHLWKSRLISDALRSISQPLRMNLD